MLILIIYLKFLIKKDIIYNMSFVSYKRQLQSTCNRLTYVKIRNVRENMLKN